MIDLFSWRHPTPPESFIFGDNKNGASDLPLRRFAIQLSCFATQPSEFRRRVSNH